MYVLSAIFSGKWPRRVIEILISAASSIVFLFLDLLDVIFCAFFKFVDEFFEETASPCYCQNRGGIGTAASDDDDGESELSETLYERKNFFRDMGFFGFSRKCQGSKKIQGWTVKTNRWSDCGCMSCLSWVSNGDQKLHVVLREPSNAPFEDCKEKATENVIFIHGFLSSSLFWTETVFPNLSEFAKCNYRLFAADLLGFGGSPKPRDCFYTLKDHLDAIEKSVHDPFQSNSFHLVAHSMGCILALALAAKYSKSVKSITLIAPPYLPPSQGSASLTALNRLADRKLWPLILFGSSFMSWYEHLGRCVCFLICRNHRVWEWILRLLTRRRCLNFMIVDLTRHTHHSAWHTMHNVICGGAKLMDGYLEALKNSSLNVNVIQGSRDQVVPLECSNNIKLKVPHADINIIPNADHSSVVLGREEEFTQDLERIWASVADTTMGEECLQNGNT